ncbi:MAG TPA: DNA alkylation repair protein [Bacteroidales bacterium]|nr:DNA alkylation repair protein [Bacteroidales bacterium]
MEKVLKNLRDDLLKNANEKDRIAGERFFKEEVKLLGMKTALVSSIGKLHLKAIKDQSKANIFSLCEDLLSTGIMEESFVACSWSYSVNKQYEPTDFAVFERWINKYVNNWATCDTLCNHTVGTLIEIYPSLIEDLKKLAHSENRWAKRASAVSLIVPAKKGKFLSDVFEISDVLISDKDDMVQKGYGWMLKVASQAHQKEVFDYVIKHKNKMPRTALRYAIEKMPADMKAEAMKKD